MALNALSVIPSRSLAGSILVAVCVDVMLEHPKSAIILHVCLQM